MVGRLGVECMQAHVCETIKMIIIKLMKILPLMTYLFSLYIVENK